MICFSYFCFYSDFAWLQRQTATCQVHRRRSFLPAAVWLYNYHCSLQTQFLLVFNDICAAHLCCIFLHSFLLSHIVNSLLFWSIKATQVAHSLLISVTAQYLYWHLCESMAFDWLSLCCCCRSKAISFLLYSDLLRLCVFHFFSLASLWKPWNTDCLEHWWSVTPKEGVLHFFNATRM